MKLFTVLVLACLALPFGTRADIILDCPNGSKDVCTAYATELVISRWYSSKDPNCGVFIQPGTVWQSAYYGFHGDNGSAKCRDTFEEYFNDVRAALAIGMQVSGGHQAGFEQGMIVIWKNKQWFINTGVSIAPKPNWCLLDNSLLFDYGTLPAGLVNQTLTSTLTVSCTGRADGKLTLIGGNGAALSVGNSGLVATIAANGSPLGSNIALPEGRTPISIESKLVGKTSGSGVFSASGTLQLEYFY